MKNNMARLFTCLAITFFIFQSTNGQSQNTLPDHYWTFDGTSPLKDSMSSATLNVSAYNCNYKIDNSIYTGVGKSLKLDELGKIIVIAQYTLNTDLTIEFLSKVFHSLTFL